MKTGTGEEIFFSLKRSDCGFWIWFQYSKHILQQRVNLSSHPLWLFCFCCPPWYSGDTYKLL